MPWIVASLFAAIAVALLMLLLRERAALRAMSAEKDAVVREERQVLDFLHGLGEAPFLEDSSTSIHRIIVDGVVSVIGAQGGALYIASQDGVHLVPAYCSPECPPLVPLPERILERERSAPGSMLGYLRLHAIPANEGVLGQVFQNGVPTYLPDLRQHQGFRRLAAPGQRGAAALAVRLEHRGKPLGVLAIASHLPAKPFDAKAQEIFASIAEQSAYALGNAIAHREAESKRRLVDELHNASQIQRVLLPKRSPKLEDYSIAAANVPARIVSGDYYDYIKVDSSRYGVAIGDVSGKGIAASLVMAMCRSVLRANARAQPSPAAALRAVNRLLFPDIREDMFVSMSYLILTKGSGEITLARAGHDPALHYHHESSLVERIEPPGLALGIDTGNVFDRILVDHPLTMSPGDCLLLTTDGVNEAIDHKGLEFGARRLEQAFREAAHLSPSKIVKHLQTTLATFVGDHPQADDITLIAIKRR